MNQPEPTMSLGDLLASDYPDETQSVDLVESEVLEALRHVIEAQRIYNAGHLMYLLDGARARLESFAEAWRE